MPPTQHFYTHPLSLETVTDCVTAPKITLLGFCGQIEGGDEATPCLQKFDAEPEKNGLTIEDPSIFNLLITPITHSDPADILQGHRDETLIRNPEKYSGVHPATVWGSMVVADNGRGDGADCQFGRCNEVFVLESTKWGAIGDENKE